MPMIDDGKLIYDQHQTILRGKRADLANINEVYENIELQLKLPVELVSYVDNGSLKGAKLFGGFFGLIGLSTLAISVWATSNILMGNVLENIYLVAFFTFLSACFFLYLSNQVLQTGQDKQLAFVVKRCKTLLKKGEIYTAEVIELFYTENLRVKIIYRISDKSISTIGEYLTKNTDIKFKNGDKIFVLKHGNLSIVL
jgi:hypothetical protein